MTNGWNLTFLNGKIYNRFSCSLRFLLHAEFLDFLHYLNETAMICSFWSPSASDSLKLSNFAQRYINFRLTNFLFASHRIKFLVKIFLCVLLCQNKLLYFQDNNGFCGFSLFYSLGCLNKIQFKSHVIKNFGSSISSNIYSSFCIDRLIKKCIFLHLLNSGV